MKKLFAALFIMAVFQFVCAQEEPVTNEDKMEENAGKEEAVAPAEEPAPASEPAAQQETAVKEEPAAQSADEGGSKFQRFVNRKGKKALAGVKLGLNISHFWGDDVNNSDPDAGYFFGLFFEYAFIKNLSLQAELNFTDKGDDNFSWEYFEIPVIANGIIPVNDMVWVTAGAGLYVAFAYTNPAFIGFGRNVVDGGMVIRGGVEINTNVGVFVADLRYTLGFAEVWDDVDCRNGVFSILAGYAVPLPF